MNTRPMRPLFAPAMAIFLLIAGTGKPSARAQGTNPSPSATKDYATAANEATASSMAMQLTTAIKMYQMDYGIYPPEGSQAKIMAALMGDNQHKIIYFEAAKKNFNDKGELIDPWGTPYKIDIDYTYSRPIEVQVWSAGKNKVFDGDAKGSDDIRGWH